VQLYTWILVIAINSDNRQIKQASDNTLI